ncbi:uncharacterized protein PAC_07141 [Phialocephala subalpina]|uniref:BZIP domain-containing protein n=1 Tax=Phialocephala subalpina TaxID=576137 RepID=A0A1L7WWV0_9HELO|nr:uncharacterized protein PAC_07141 [Phialocephala subalpina]
MVSIYESKHNSVLDGTTLDPSRPNMQRQDSNSDLHSFFNDADMATSTLMPPSSLSNQMSWGMDQLFDFNGGNEYPFPGSQPTLSSAFAPTQEHASFMTGLSPQNMLSMSNSLVPAAGVFAGQSTAAPSALFNSTSTPSGYTRQATGTSMKRPVELTESTEATEEPAPKKPRKTRKKRSKELSQAEQEEKRQKFLDRNKVAAHKCRQRKKEWTDSLQNRANDLSRSIQSYQMEIQTTRHMLEEMKMIARQALSGCTPEHAQQIEAALNSLEAKEATGFAAEEEKYKAMFKTQRNGVTTSEEHSREESQAMSRGPSGQSMQSSRSSDGQLSSQGRTERIDSGISNMGTPEKSHDRKGSFGDEAVDVDNGFPYMMPNQRLGSQPTQWHHGLPNKPMGPLADMPGADPSAFIARMGQIGQ